MDIKKYQKEVNFINDYKKSKNAATGSKYDSNANVDNKNIATLTSELAKKPNIGINRLFMYKKITELYDEYLAKEYIRQLEEHEIYKHDETSLNPYCVSITMYPFLLDGLKSIGGQSTPPTNLFSFVGAFINLVFIISSQFAGACSTPEFFLYLDYFIRKEYGEDYYLRTDDIAYLSLNKRTIKKVISDIFQQVVYSINQPAAARGFQSVFWNVAYYDKPYFKGLFEEFVFPDGGMLQWESLDWLQRFYMNWFNEERLKSPSLTFPVETMNLLNDKNNEYVDKEYANFTAEMYAKGHSFFTYRSDNVDSLASCCRLRNEIADNSFSYTLGAGGVSTGSKGVITININRLVQNATKAGVSIRDAIIEQTDKVRKYLNAYNEITKENFEAGLLSVYNAGYISLEKQFLTIGINGFVEGAEFLGIEIGDNEDYAWYAQNILEPIFHGNKNAKTKELMFNTEYVPAENLGVKNAMWDKKDGYFVPRDCYNSYFYVVEDESTNLIDKFILHGGNFTKFLDGGLALHANLDEHLTFEQYRRLLDVATQTGCNYFTFNIPNTICNKCGHISKQKLKTCPKCSSTDLDYLTRVIGYLKRISSFSEARQEEAGRRYYHDKVR